MYYIYTLECPVTAQVRYIGKTNNLSKRLSAHCKDKVKSHKSSWIKSLNNKGLKPVVTVLDQTEDEQECYKLEQYWIAQFRAWGFDLTNLTNGGEGFSGKDVSGEKNFNSKISESIARLIISDIKKQELTLTEICIKYDVGLGTVGNIKYGHSWSSITGGPVVTERYKQKETGIKNRAQSLRDKGVYDRQSIKIQQCTLDGVFVKEFDSVSEAAKQTSTNRSSISSCISGKLKSANGFLWKRK